MLFWERFYDLCLKNDVSPNAVCSELELSNSAATHWKKGVIPKADAVLKVSYYFDCSTDYLLGRSNNLEKSTEKVKKEDCCNPDKQKETLLDNYEKLNDKGKKELVRLSEFTLGNPDYLKEDCEDNKNVS